jgi:hypothetical protein
VLQKTTRTNELKIGVFEREGEELRKIRLRKKKTQKWKMKNNEHRIRNYNEEKIQTCVVFFFIAVVGFRVSTAVN